MKKLLPFSLIAIASLIIVACAPQALQSRDLYSYDSVPGTGGGEAPMEAPAAVEPEMGIVDVDQSATNASGIPAAQTERIVIKNADLAIVVKDVEGRMRNIQVMAEQMGGFVVSSNLYESYTSNYVEVPEGQVVIRVPSDRLEEAMDNIKKDVVEVQSETVSGQDVTAEYVDLQSRLKSLEAAEAQLEEIMKTATETEDVVNIFNQLVSYREQIEVVKGQIKYYDEAASLSAVSVRIIAEETVQPVVIGSWEPKGIALEAVQDLIDFLQGFSEFLIRFVIYILPSWIIVGIPLYLLFIGGRALFRKLRGTKKTNEEPKDIESEEVVEKK